MAGVLPPSILADVVHHTTRHHCRAKITLQAERYWSEDQIGANGGTRTLDLTLTKGVLYQLSHIGVFLKAQATMAGTFKNTLSEERGAVRLQGS